MEGGDCYRRDDRRAQYHCKPSFRLKFSKDAPLSAGVETLFRYPADKQSCNSVRKFVLNVRTVSLLSAFRVSLLTDAASSCRATGTTRRTSDPSSHKIC